MIPQSSQGEEPSMGPSLLIPGKAPPCLGMLGMSPGLVAEPALTRVGWRHALESFWSLAVGDPTLLGSLEFFLLHQAKDKGEKTEGR